MTIQAGVRSYICHVDPQDEILGKIVRSMNWIWQFYLLNNPMNIGHFAGILLSQRITSQSGVGLDKKHTDLLIIFLLTLNIPQRLRCNKQTA